MAEVSLVEFVIRWMSPDSADDKSTLVQIMAWCRQATLPNVDPDLGRHMRLLGHNELIQQAQAMDIYSESCLWHWSLPPEIIPCWHPSLQTYGWETQCYFSSHPIKQLVLCTRYFRRMNLNVCLFSVMSLLPCFGVTCFNYRLVQVLM